MLGEVFELCGPGEFFPFLARLGVGRGWWTGKVGSMASYDMQLSFSACDSGICCTGADAWLSVYTLPRSFALPHMVQA
jgi:hypothetical protein